MNPTSIVNMTLAITMYYMPVTAIWLSHTKGVKYYTRSQTSKILLTVMKSLLSHKAGRQISKIHTV